MPRRIYEHKFGFDKKCYTYNKRPVKLKFAEEIFNPIDAIEFEKKVKEWSRKKKEALFKRDWKRIRELSRSKKVRV